MAFIYTMYIIGGAILTDWTASVYPEQMPGHTQHACVSFLSFQFHPARPRDQILIYGPHRINICSAYSIVSGGPVCYKRESQYVKKIRTVYKRSIH